MSTTTANLGLTLPTPNVDSGWGGTLNTDFTLIDDLFAAAGTGTSVGLQVGTGKTLNAGGTIIAGGTLILGSGDGTNTVTPPTIRGAARTGTNAAGGNLTIDAINGTGTGGSGKIIFRTAPASGTPGTAANTMASVLEVNSAGAVGIANASYGSSNQVLFSNGSAAPPSWGNVTGSVLTIPSQAQGDLLYRGASAWDRLPAGTSGQILRTNGPAANPSWTDKIAVAGAQNTTSGTNIDFTSIPAGTKKITVTFNDVQHSGAGQFLMQFGTASSIETTGYESSGFDATASGNGGSTSTSGILVRGVNALSGHMLITNVSGNIWIASYIIASTGSSTLIVAGGGFKTLSGVLTRIRFTTTSTGTFNNGSMNAFYE